ncbi:MAG: hypothetical protein RR228_01475 [Bacilli bacterium]
MKKIKLKLSKIIPAFVLLSVSIPIVFLIIKLIISKTYEPETFLTIMVSVLVVFAFFVPSIAAKKLKLDIPEPLYISFVLFLYGAAFLGELKGFFYTYAYWDEMLHFTSAIMLGILGFSILLSLDDRSTKIKFSPFVVALFALCFTMAAGVVWEIFEYTMDEFFLTNMQKFMLENGKQFIGHAAVADTMKDLIIDTIGGLIISVMGYFSIRNNNKWLNNIIIKKK